MTSILCNDNVYSIMVYTTNVPYDIASYYWKLDNLNTNTINDFSFQIVPTEMFETFEIVTYNVRVQYRLSDLSKGISFKGTVQDPTNNNEYKLTVTNTEGEELRIYDDINTNEKPISYYFNSFDSSLKVNIRIKPQHTDNIYIALTILKKGGDQLSYVYRYSEGGYITLKSNEKMLYSPQLLSEHILHESIAFLNNIFVKFYEEQGKYINDWRMNGMLLGSSTITNSTIANTIQDIRIRKYNNDASLNFKPQDTTIETNSICMYHEITDTNFHITSQYSTKIGSFVFEIRKVDNNKYTFVGTGMMMTYVKGSDLSNSNIGIDENTIDITKTYSVFFGHVKKDVFTYLSIETQDFSIDVNGTSFINKNSYKLIDNVPYGIIDISSNFTNNQLVYQKYTDIYKGISFDASCEVTLNGANLNEVKLKLDTTKVTVNTQIQEYFTYQDNNKIMPSVIVLRKNYYPDVNGYYFKYNYTDNTYDFFHKYGSRSDTTFTDFSGKTVSLLIMSEYTNFSIHRSYIEPIWQHYAFYNTDNVDSSSQFISSSTIKIESDTTLKVTEFSSNIISIIDETIDTYIKKEFENLLDNRTIERTSLENRIANEKIGDYINYIDTGLANTVNSTMVLTEIPSFHIGIFFSYEDADGSINILSKQTLNDNSYNKFREYVEKYVNFMCSDQNLYPGNNENTITLPQILKLNKAGSNHNTEILRRIKTRGNKTSKYEYETYLENAIYTSTASSQTNTNYALYEINSITNEDNIGIYDDLEQRGLIVYLNANVPIEHHNGLTIELNTGIRNIKKELLPLIQDTSINVHFFTCVKNNNDIMRKVGIDLTDPNMAQHVVDEVKSKTFKVGHAKYNQYIVNSKKISLDEFIYEAQDNDNDPYYNLYAPVYVYPLVDLFRSVSTTLIAANIVLHSELHIDTYRRELIYKEGNYGSLEDRIQFLMITHRILYDYDKDADNDKNGLNNMFYPKNNNQGISNVFTITQKNPEKIIDFDSIENNGILDISNHKIVEIDSRDCGHENIFVETVYILVSAFGRILIDGQDTPDNLFWYLTDRYTQNYLEIPKTIFGHSTEDDTTKTNKIDVISYRRNIYSHLIENAQPTANLFANFYRKVEVPPSHMSPGELYSAYYIYELLRFFEADKLVNTKKKIPIVYEDNGEYLSFPSLNYETNSIDNYDYISITYMKIVLGDALYDSYFGDTYDKQLFYKSGPDISNGQYLKDFFDYITPGLIDFSNINPLTSRLTNLYEELQIYISTADNKLNESLRLDIDISGNGKQYPITKYMILFLESLYRTMTYSEVTSVNKVKLIGTSSLFIKDKFDTVPFAIELSSRRRPKNLLMETTSIRLSEIQFADHSILRNIIVNSVGIPIDSIIPIVLDLKTSQVTTVVNREITFDTDYLLETQNAIDRSRIMNQIFYYIKDNKRIVTHVKRRSNKLIGPDYQYVKIGSNFVEDIHHDKDFPNLLTRILMGDGDEDRTIYDLMADNNFGMLKLAGVKDDDIVRGLLRDYRYHGNKVIDAKPMFADDVPSIRGGLGMQVLRMISSGLINKQNHGIIISNDAEIVKSIRDPQDDIDEVTWEDNDDRWNFNVEYPDKDPINNERFVSRVAKNIDAKLNTKTTTTQNTSEYMRLQFILNQIFTRDPIRFYVNETKRNSIDPLSEIANDLKEGDNVLYMLPIIEQDTLKLGTIINGVITDPYEIIQDKMQNIINNINTSLNNQSSTLGGSTSGGSKVGTTSISITGYPYTIVDGTITRGAIKGTFYDCSNILLYPQHGPYEKEIVQMVHDKTILDGTQSAHYDEIKTRLNLDDDEDVYSRFMATYLRLRERTFQIQYKLGNKYNFDSYEILNDGISSYTNDFMSDIEKYSSILNKIENYDAALNFTALKTDTDINNIEKYEYFLLREKRSNSRNESYRIILNDDMSENRINIRYVFEQFDKLINTLQEKNIYTSVIDIYKHIVFKIKLTLPVTSQNSDVYTSIAKFERYNDNVSKYTLRNDLNEWNKGKFNTMLFIQEFMSSQWNSMLKGVDELNDPNGIYTTSSNRNVYAVLSKLDSKDKDNTYSYDDYTIPIYLKTYTDQNTSIIDNMNILDIVLLSLYGYTQESRITQNSYTITQNWQPITTYTFIQSIERMEQALAEANIYIPMDLIYEEMNTYLQNKTEHKDKIFLNDYIQIMRSIAYKTRIMETFIEYMKQLINAKDSHYTYITKQKLSLYDNIKMQYNKVGPFTIDFYHKMLTNNEDYPEYRLVNFSNIFKTFFELQNVDSSIQRELWRLDMLLHLQDDSGNYAYKYVVDKMSSNDKLSVSKMEDFIIQYIFKDQDVTNNTIEIHNTHYEDSYMSDLSACGSEIVTALESSLHRVFAYKAPSDDSEHDSSQNIAWKYPFDYHPIEYVPVPVLKNIYNDLNHKLDSLKDINESLTPLSSNISDDIDILNGFITNLNNSFGDYKTYIKGDGRNENLYKLIIATEYGSMFYNHESAFTDLINILKSNPESVSISTYTDLRKRTLADMELLIDIWLA